MSDIGIQNALVALIAGISPSIVPQTTLSLQAASGATSITVTDGSHFQPGGWLVFNDALGEETLDIASVTANVIALDFTGLGYTGLSHTHAQGTVVYTNLDTECPLAIGQSLSGGDPLITVSIRHEKRVLRYMGGPAKHPVTYTAQIDYLRQLTRPDDAQMGVNRWAKRQQETARTDMNTIAAALEANRKLVTAGQEFAIDLGELRSGRPFLEKDWGRLVKIKDIEAFAASMTVLVSGQFL